MGDPLQAPALARRPLHGAVIVETAPPWSQTVTAHREARGTQGDALRVDVCRRAGGCRMLASTRIEGNDGGDGFGLEKVIDAIRVEATVVDDGAHRDRHHVGGAELEEAV